MVSLLWLSKSYSPSLFWDLKIIFVHLLLLYCLRFWNLSHTLKRWKYASSGLAAHMENIPFREFQWFDGSMKQLTQSDSLSLSSFKMGTVPNKSEFSCVFSLKTFSGVFLVLLSDWQLDRQTQTCCCLVVRHGEGQSECNRPDTNQMHTHTDTHTHTLKVNPKVENGNSKYDGSLFFPLNVCVCVWVETAGRFFFMTIQSPSSPMLLLIPYTHTYIHTHTHTHKHRWL